ncbi:hypothetical protein JZ751_018352 [Albula glossodonta]|uniref:Uncharacterized protein n=1 Tax=Albula glossodonta TaxID=121402 RepID=A0A8T2NPN5_9TELE|nr:hypothetical protein JZ751_018352 [Albula glossodonta]
MNEAASAGLVCLCSSSQSWLQAAGEACRTCACTPPDCANMNTSWYNNNSEGSSISSESSPVSSPATNHSSPVSTPKRGPMGPIIVPPGGHSVPSTPPVVTIAPTKTVNGLWRSESRQGLDKQAHRA